MAVAYAIVAWLVIQIVVAVKTPLHLPAWTDTLVIVLLLAGLAPALVLSWMFDLTPEGLKRTRETPPPRAPATGRRIEYALLGLMAVAVGWLYYRTEFPGYQTVSTTVAGPLRKSVAVLPFENLSPDPNNAFFAAGIHEEILNQLAKIRDLSVIARTSVLQYQNTKKTIGEIAKDLNVATVVEGSVRYDNNRHVRVTAQFIDAASGAHLWSEDYDRTLDDIFGIQTDIASRIAVALEAQLSGAERETIGKIPTKSPEAYTLYLKAQTTFEGTSRTFVQAQSYLDQAIALDPNFAQAYAAKALYYLIPLVPATAAVPEELATRVEYATQGRRNAQRALKLDPLLGVAYEALGWADEYDWKWSDAAAALKRAVDLSPNEPRTLSAYGFYLFATDRDRAEGLRLVRRAISLDPNMYVWRMALAVMLERSGDRRGAAQAYRKVIDLLPTTLQAHGGLAVLDAAAGDMQTARREASTAELLWRNDSRPSLAPILIRAYRAVGRRDDERRIFGELSTMAKTQPVSAMTWFLAYQAMEDRDNAVAWFQKAVDTHDTYGYELFWTRSRSEFTALIWDDPRFQEARKALGFD